jgi:hypothetical protein
MLFKTFLRSFSKYILDGVVGSLCDEVPAPQFQRLASQRSMLKRHTQQDQQIRIGNKNAAKLDPYGLQRLYRPHGEEVPWASVRRCCQQLERFEDAITLHIFLFPFCAAIVNSVFPAVSLMSTGHPASSEEMT